MNRRRRDVTMWGGGASDVVAPTVVITCDKASPTAESPLTFTYTWSEDVTGFEIGDAGIAEGTKGTFTAVDASHYTLVVTPDNTGTVTATVAAGVCIDAAGNANEEATPLAISIIVTLTLQPDTTAGKDVFIYQGLPTQNFATDTRLYIGNGGVADNRSRQLIQFDLSTIPTGATITSAVMSLYCNAETSANAHTMRVYRIKRAWVEAQATWNIFATSNDWQTLGGFGANDCEQTDIGNRDFSATETLNQFKDFALTAASIQDMISGGSFTNNGFLIKVDTELSDLYEFASSDHATAAQRPKLVVVYSTP